MTSSDWTSDSVYQLELLESPSARSTIPSQYEGLVELSIDESDACSNCRWLQDSNHAHTTTAQLRNIFNMPDEEHFAKRQRIAAADDVQSKPVPHKLGRPSWNNNLIECLTNIDLTEATEVPQSLKGNRSERRVRIAAFQCVICMDNVSALTVTHCGHLYCQQCLHSSLNVGAAKGKCPMCRTKVDMRARSSYNSKTKGLWPVELKLLTMAKLGKRKFDCLS